MTSETRRLWKSFMEEARVRVNTVEYTKVDSSWRYIDFVPEFNRLYLIEEGEGLIRIEDTEYYPSSRQLVLMPAGIRQSYSTISDHTFGKYWCHFTAYVGDLRLFDVLKTPTIVRVADDERWGRWVKLFRSLRQELRSDSFTAGLRVQSIMLELIASFIEQADDATFAPTSAAVDKIHSIIRYMEQHLEDQHTVEELARIVHYHPNYFIRVFKQFTGRSPIQYLNALRLERAKNWLAATDTSVSEIAENVGMTLFYFSRFFKEQTGFTPSSYRRMNRN
ncbi:AraC family transcriptional regulator [Paenibacillus humicola]|uniref:AraC family transcriptional regulator n=1 Tax=Paenibacillus humicola TaxID=3110540 RepID=UPI00237BCB47|nr:AraC family transcriptional regulator [Paenibacillus humicola]